MTPPMLLDPSQADAIAHAAQVLARGELLGLPTETVYGLAADAGNDAAVRRIFAAKGRPADHPLIVHVTGVDDVAVFAHDVPGFAAKLMAAFWPGPLTLILPRRAGVAAVAAGGQDSVGLRCPSHPLAQAVLRAAQDLGVRGVAAPSANLFGRVSPTTAAHVASEFPDLCVLDGGACEVGIESTIVDCTRGVPVLLRPGMLTPAQLQAACGVPVRAPSDFSSTDAPDAAGTTRPTNGNIGDNIDGSASGFADGLGAAPRASGTLASHYAPRAYVRLMPAASLQAALADKPLSLRVAVWHRSLLALDFASDEARCSVWLLPMPGAPEACAHALFATLRDFDAKGVAEIWVEQPPADVAWAGVRDRLMRAATPARGSSR